MRTAAGSYRHVVVLGGNSEIALAALRAMLTAHPGHTGVTLCGRELAALWARREDLVRAGARFVHPLVFDAELDDPATVLENAALMGGEVDVVFVAFGRLGEQSDLFDPVRAKAQLELNGALGARALVSSYQHLAGQGRGTLVAFSSIAAVRVRGTNPLYGAGKAAFDAVACALGAHSASDGVRVIVARFGFVHSAMTKGLRPAPGAISSDRAGELLARSVREADSWYQVAWIPGAMRLVAGLLRVLPAQLLRRLR